MVSTKCIYDEAEMADGLRVLVTRYWPRGVSKERADQWMRGLAPSPELIRDWKSESIGWAEFKARYESELGCPEKQALLEELRGVARGAGRVTLLCSCRQESACHRGLLKAMLAP